MNMKTCKSTSVAILAALSLYSPWAVQNCIAQTETNLYRAKINLVCIAKNANGNLVQDEVGTAEFVREYAELKGVTDISELVLAYNRTDSSLQVVNRNTREVLGTPLNFDGGTTLVNSNNTRVERVTHVTFDMNPAASGLLTATERLTYAKTNRLTSFGLLGRISYTFNEGTSAATICRGTLAVGSSIAQEPNNSNQFQGNNQGNDVINLLFGTTNVNQGGFGNGGN